MLVIRSEQMAVLAAVALHQFEDEMVGHVRDHASRLFDVRGEIRTRELIKSAIVRAGRFGFTLRGPIRFYLELMLALGVDFDTDPQFEWAQDILRSPACPDQMVRANQLHLAMNDYFDSVVGPDNQFAVQALRRSQGFDLQRSVLNGVGSFPDRMMAVMHEAYPEKCVFAGPARLQRLVDRAVAACVAMGLHDEGGHALMAGLMFGFGHGIVDDPMYPWVRNTLDRPQPMPRRIERLAAKTQLYMAAMLAHLGPAA